MLARHGSIVPVTRLFAGGHAFEHGLSFPGDGGRRRLDQGRDDDRQRHHPDAPPFSQDVLHHGLPVASARGAARRRDAGYDTTL